MGEVGGNRGQGRWGGWRFWKDSTCLGRVPQVRQGGLGLGLDWRQPAYSMEYLGFPQSPGIRVGILGIFVADPEGSPVALNHVSIVHGISSY